MFGEEERLRGVIERNREAFERLKEDANRWRDRALQAEAALREARRKAGHDPTMDLIDDILRRRNY